MQINVDFGPKAKLFLCQFVLIGLNQVRCIGHPSDYFYFIFPLFTIFWGFDFAKFYWIIHCEKANKKINVFNT